MGAELQFDWVEGRRLFEHEGLSYREIGAKLGCSNVAVRKHSEADGWTRENESLAKRDAERSANARAGAVAAQSQWVQRRLVEADAAGVTAAIARQRVVTAMADNNHLMTRAAVIAYAILVDKAQLLSGGATARMTTGDEVHDHAEKLFDELDLRRESAA